MDFVFPFQIQDPSFREREGVHFFSLPRGEDLLGGVLQESWRRATRTPGKAFFFLSEKEERGSFSSRTGKGGFILADKIVRLPSPSLFGEEKGLSVAEGIEGIPLYAGTRRDISGSFFFFPLFRERGSDVAFSPFSGYPIGEELYAFLLPFPPSC